MNGIIHDLNRTTDIPINSLVRVSENINLCVANAFYESLQNCETITTYDIGIGKLLIGLKDNGIHYKFIPSKQLEGLLIDVANGNGNPIVQALDKSLVDKIIRTYKEAL